MTHITSSSSSSRSATSSASSSSSSSASSIGCGGHRPSCTPAAIRLHGLRLQQLLLVDDASVLLLVLAPVVHVLLLMMVSPAVAMMAVAMVVVVMAAATCCCCMLPMPRTSSSCSSIEPRTPRSIQAALAAHVALLRHDIPANHDVLDEVRLALRLKVWVVADPSDSTLQLLLVDVENVLPTRHVVGAFCHCARHLCLLLQQRLGTLMQLLLLLLLWGS
jgi:hypothetical protein